MPTCNKILQSEGKSYPRTCAKCGLGPCKNLVSDEVANGHTPLLKSIAGMIQKLSYRDMQALAAIVAKNVTDSSAEGYAKALLTSADQILLEKLSK